MYATTRVDEDSIYNVILLDLNEFERVHTFKLDLNEIGALGIERYRMLILAAVYMARPFTT